MTERLDQSADIVDSLREDFLRGCSVSELVRRVVQHLPEDAKSTREIAQVFLAVFRIHPAKAMLLKENLLLSEEAKLKWNWLLIPEMVRVTDRDESEAWFSKVPVFTDDHHHRAEQCRGGLSEAGWNSLNAEDRRTATSNEATKMLLWEDLQILAALVETLQNQVRELQANKQPTEVA
jgi:hypothetical protein